MPQQRPSIAKKKKKRIFSTEKRKRICTVGKASTKKKKKRERERALKKTEAGWYTEDLCLELSDTVGLLGGCTSIFPSVLWESMRMNDPTKNKVIYNPDLLLKRMATGTRKKHS